jgi:hypothetical protein
MKKDRIGEKFITNQGYEVEIIEYFNNRKCTLLFNDGNKLHNREYKCIEKGNIKNPMHKTLYGIGFIGYGKYSSKGLGKEAYKHWASMLCRCYNEKYQKKQPTYIDCFVSEKWHNFQIFCEWFFKNYKKGFELDKDILLKGNKIYSEDNCCFVPKEINNLLLKNNKKRNNLPIGVHKQKNRYIAQHRIKGQPFYLGSFLTKEDAFLEYKKYKEMHIKKKALQFEDKIPFNVFNVLYNYEVSIND